MLSTRHRSRWPLLPLLLCLHLLFFFSQSSPSSSPSWPILCPGLETAVRMQVKMLSIPQAPSARTDDAPLTMAVGDMAAVLTTSPAGASVDMYTTGNAHSLDVTSVHGALDDLSCMSSKPFVFTHQSRQERVQAYIRFPPPSSFSSHLEMLAHFQPECVPLWQIYGAPIH